ncbi:MAG: hypothetical protein R8G33_06835 [Gammaproteobacteria bacterium]|nr:hypothetical protein [Gammaproteobacteria bacterium]
MNDETKVIKIINTETLAFDTQDAELFLSILHPDMVWPWPPNVDAHNPLEWVLPWGRYNERRWRGYLDKFFDKYDLIHNIRQTRKIEISKERDGAFAVVDVDTLWKTKSGDELHWHGRACKIYTTSDSRWLMISQTGLLKY